MKKKLAPGGQRVSHGKFRPYLIAFSIPIVPLVVGIIYRLATADRILIPIGVIALVGGVLTESKRIFNSWRIIATTAFASLALSCIAFFPSKHESPYSFEDNLEVWPYVFIFIFATACALIHPDKITPKLNEGITLIQSFALMYWIADYRRNHESNFLFTIVVVCASVIFLYALYHAFTYAELTKKQRFRLSILSTAVTLFLAVDNIYMVHQNDYVEYATSVTHAVSIFIQYFLLGTVTIYSVQNLFMLASFLPSRHKLSNKQYARERKEQKNLHIERYSPKQTSITTSFFCIVCVSIIFTANLYFQILPRHLAIWSVLAVMPLVLDKFESWLQQRSTSLE